MGVDLGGADVSMAKHFLHVPDTGSTLEHFGGAGVAPDCRQA